MAVELAVAYVQIVPSTRGLAGQMRSEVGGPLESVVSAAGESGGRQFGRNLLSNAVSGFESLGDTILRTARRGLTVAGVAAGGVVSLGLFGGMQRALDREDAIISFRRLGLDQSNIDQLVDGIDQALSGTPIANPEGFAAAGRFLAQGFDEADVPGIIGTLADMSAVGNRSFAEMADVLVAAAGQGRITAAELNRLGDIPLGRVAEELGLAESELREMVSSGELTVETFIEAFAAIDEFNGAARDQTTRVAFENLKTAVRNLGEQFLGPLFGENGAAQRALVAMRGFVDDLRPAVAAAGDSFARWLIPAIQDGLLPALRRMADVWTDTVLPALRTVRDWIADNRDMWEPIVRAAGPTVAIIAGLAVAVSAVSRAFGLLSAAGPVGILTGIVGGLVYLWQNSETFRDVVTGAFEAALGAWSTFRDWVLKGGGGIIEIWEGLKEAGLRLYKTLQGVFAGMSDAAEDFDVANSVAMKNVQAIFESVGNIIVGVLDLVNVALGRTADEQETTGARIIDALNLWATVQTSVVRWILFQIELVIAGLVWLGETASKIKDGIVSALETLRTAFTTFKDAVGDDLDGVVAFFVKLPGRILAAFVNPGGLLVGIGQAIIGGLLGGMVSAWTDARSWLSGLAQQIKDVKGPYEADAVLLVGAGEAIMGGLQRGMQSQWPQIERDLRRMTSQIARTVPQTSGLQVASAAGPEYNLTVNMHGTSNDELTPERMLTQLRKMVLLHEPFGG